MAVNIDTTISDGGCKYSVTVCSNDNSVYSKIIEYANTILSGNTWATLYNAKTEEIINELKMRDDVDATSLDFDKYEKGVTVAPISGDKALLLINTNLKQEGKDA